MNLANRIKKSLRGGVSLNSLFSEFFRRRRERLKQRRERIEIGKINDSAARLRSDFENVGSQKLLNHFKQRENPAFLPRNSDETARIQTEFFREETAKMLADAEKIVNEKKWSLLGFGEMSFAHENVWRRDPLSGADWGLDYHADLKLAKTDGSDIRVLWELNRFGNFLTLACAYSVTNDENFADEFFAQIADWKQQNPYGRGANWTCAMEVALRAINVLTAFGIFRQSSAMNEKNLSEILQFFDLHGHYIVENSEFSYISTSNHYLTNVAGLLWLGVLLPELKDANEWRETGLRELLREMNKQILPDGADYESSTCYHRFVTELFLYSFRLCTENGIEIPAEYLEKLRLMLEYVRAYLRPDGFAPLIGDVDGGQFLPFIKRDADDHEYLASIGARFFDDAKLKSSNQIPIEVLWLAGAENFEKYKNVPKSNLSASSAFAQTGVYILRDDDLYLLFNAQDCGLNGRGSHAHNDKLSIEVSAFGSPFVVDAGTFAYGFDTAARHVFRSTAYHSTAQIDGAEQNTIDAKIPFVIGNEARPIVLDWKSDDRKDFVSAEHYGYARLKSPVTHRRSVEFNKTEKFWIIEDEFFGKGRHRIQIRFHLAPDIRIETHDEQIALVDVSGNRLIIKTFGFDVAPETEKVWVSRNYGERRESLSLCWTIEKELPFKARFAIVPSRANEKVERLAKAFKKIGGR